MRMVAGDGVEVGGFLSQDRPNWKTPRQGERRHLTFTASALFLKYRDQEVEGCCTACLARSLELRFVLDLRKHRLRVVTDQRLLELNLLLRARFQRSIGAFKILAGTLTHLDKAVGLRLLLA